MSAFLACSVDGPPFRLFGTAHLGALLALVLLNLALAFARRAGEGLRAKVRWSLAILLWGNELAWHLWNMGCERWTVQSMLPLQVCSLMVWLCGLMLATRSKGIYAFAYFLGIGGGLHALAAPDLGAFGFPHFRFFQTVLSHGLIVTAPLYLTLVEGFRPSCGGLARTALGLNAYALAIYFVNRALGSNYLMVNGKPATPSLLDVLPGWPWYLIHVEAIGLATLALLYAPFALQRLSRRGKQRRESDA